MDDRKTPQGPWRHRFLVRLFAVVFALLIYQLLSFLVGDIGAAGRPSLKEVEKGFVDQALLDREEDLQKQISAIERTIASVRAEAQLASDHAASLQKTVDQLLELQRTRQEESTAGAGANGPLMESLRHFLAGQADYQQLNKALAEWTEKQLRLEEDLATTRQTLQAQRKPARAAYEERLEAFRLQRGVLQLALLLPLLGLVGWLALRHRGGIYFPLHAGAAAGVLLKTSLVAHHYFPSRYFKYILIIALIIIVARLLIHFMRIVAFPKAQWLTRQYREAYERFLCPVCEYPVRTGPRKFLYWTRRTVNSTVMPGNSASEEDAPYACPACGAQLFEACARCGEIRHSLLPHCSHCNDEKPVVVAPPPSQ